MAKNKKYYVNNEEFMNELSKFNQTGIISDKLGDIFLKISNGFAQNSNFRNYTYIEDMISDGVFDCCRYADRFNPEKSSNPFSYFTQIIYYAFLRHINKEKKVSYGKNILLLDSLSCATNAIQSNDIHEYLNLNNTEDYIEFVRQSVSEYEEKNNLNSTRQNQPSKYNKVDKNNLEGLI